MDLAYAPRNSEKSTTRLFMQGKVAVDQHTNLWI